MNKRILGATIILTTACLALGLSNRVRAAGDPVISFSSALGLQPDGRYHIQLQGSFDSASDTRVIVLCDDQITPSTVHAATASTLDISIPAPRDVTRCSFVAHRMTDGARSIPTLAIAPTSQDTITGWTDRGTNGGRHGVELYGSFPNYSTLQITVFCTQGGDINNTTTPYIPATQIDVRSPTQLNLTFNEPGNFTSAPRCSFTPLHSSFTGAPETRRPMGPVWGPTTLSPFDLYAGTSGFGAYFWAAGAAMTTDVDDALASGQRWISRAGLNVARVWMSPKMRNRTDNQHNPYHINLDILENECPSTPQYCQGGVECNASPAFLPCAARSSAFQKLFRSRELSYIIITAADAASSDDYGGGAKYMRTPTWFDSTINTQKVVDEYRNFALALYETQHDTGKHFVISNWESDSEIFSCKTINEVPPGGCTTVFNATEIAQRVSGLKRFASARKLGISQARTIAQARGIATGIDVGDGIEFNFWAGGAGGGSPFYKNYESSWAINSIIPEVMPSYMSYSAWGSVGYGTMDQDINDLKQQFPNNAPQLLLGELGAGASAGYMSTSRGQVDAWLLKKNARASQRAQLPATVLYWAYDGPPTDLVSGFFDADGRERQILGALRSELAAGQQELAEVPSARIGAIAVRRAGMYDLFEMYIDTSYGAGVFPGNNINGIQIRCSYTCSDPNNCNTGSITFDGIEPAVNPTWGLHQSNVAIRHKAWASDSTAFLPRNCTVKIPGVLTHGPKALCMIPGSACSIDSDCCSGLSCQGLAVRTCRMP